MVNAEKEGKKTKEQNAPGGRVVLLPGDGELAGGWWTLNSGPKATLNGGMDHANRIGKRYRADNENLSANKKRGKKKVRAHHLGLMKIKKHAGEVKTESPKGERGMNSYGRFQQKERAGTGDLCCKKLGLGEDNYKVRKLDKNSLRERKTKGLLGEVRPVTP